MFDMIQPIDVPPDVRTYLDRLMATTSAQLGGDLVAVYLIGSLVLGGFEPATSDVDLMVIAARMLPTGRRVALADAIGGVPIPVRGLEYVVYPRDAVAKPAPAPQWDLNVNVGPRLAARHVGLDPAAEDRYWAVLDLAVVRSAGVALVGPPPSDIVGEVPSQQIVDALREGLVWHDTSDRASPNRVLNTVRAWHWAVEGRFVSKAAAARWALDRTGNPVITEALRLRATGVGSLDAAAVDRFVARVRPDLDAALATR